MGGRVLRTVKTRVILEASNLVTYEKKGEQIGHGRQEALKSCRFLYHDCRFESSREVETSSRMRTTLVVNSYRSSMDPG